LFPGFQPVLTGGHRVGAMQLRQTTVYAKVYHHVSDFGFLDPFDVKMDCLNYQLSAPIR
jgi:hypothetical protein